MQTCCAAPSWSLCRCKAGRCRFSCAIICRRPYRALHWARSARLWRTWRWKSGGSTISALSTAISCPAIYLLRRQRADPWISVLWTTTARAAIQLGCRTGCGGAIWFNSIVCRWPAFRFRTACDFFTLIRGAINSRAGTANWFTGWSKKPGSGAESATPSMPREVFAGSCAGIRRDIEPLRRNQREEENLTQRAQAD